MLRRVSRTISRNNQSALDSKSTNTKQTVNEFVRLCECAYVQRVCVHVNSIFCRVCREEEEQNHLKNESNCFVE